MYNIETREVKEFLSGKQKTFWPEIPQGCPERYQKMIVATRARRFNKLTNTNTFYIPDGNEGAAGLEEARAEAKWMERAYLSLYSIQTELILDGDMVRKK
jgi:cob(I)alamin adenosyltransferase